MNVADDPETIALIRNCRWSVYDGQWHCRCPVAVVKLANERLRGFTGSMRELFDVFVDALCMDPVGCEDREEFADNRIAPA